MPDNPYPQHIITTPDGRQVGNTNPQWTVLAAIEKRRASDEGEAMTFNPKDAAAHAEMRTPLDLLEPVSEAQIAKVMHFGAHTKGYGIRNYLDSPIRARTYYAAMRRHLDAWLEGEEVAPDSQLHHLAHIGANVQILLAAIHYGTFIDDREARDVNSS